MSTDLPGDGPTAPSFAVFPLSGVTTAAVASGPYPWRTLYQPMDTQFMEDFWPAIPDAETGTSYPGRCVECHLRAKDEQHYHDVFGLVLDGQVHRAWFNENTFVGVGDPGYNLGSWSISERVEEPEEGHLVTTSTFLRLTIEASSIEPELKTIVWKLTDETLPDRPEWRLGKWPD